VLCRQTEPILANLQKEHKQETGKLVGVSAAPEKARRQADLAVADLSAAQHLLAVAETKRTEAEAALRGVSDQLRQRQVCMYLHVSAWLLVMVAATSTHTFIL
jgi:hypothetical protein